MMVNEGSTKIVNFMTPGAGVLVTSSALSIYSILIAIVSKNYYAAFLFDLYLPVLYAGVVDMQI